MLEAVLRDTLHGIRRVGRDRLFAAIAGATLAVGIGATTALYSVLDSALLRPLPFRDADELVWVWGTFGPDRQIRGASYPEAMDWREGARAFREFSVYEDAPLTLAVENGARQIEAEVVSAGYFEMLGVEPLLGRGLSLDDEIANAGTSVVIGHGLWQSVFGGAEDVLGRIVRLDGRPFTVVGVMPQSFLGLSFDTEAWISFAAAYPDMLADRGSRWLGTVARLAPGISVSAAEADMDRVTGLLEERFPDVNQGRRTRLLTLRDAYLSSTGALILILFGAVLFLLIIACVNVTNLQVVRGLARIQELSLRNALGASRGRLVQQLLVEGVIVAVAGAAIGTWLAVWGLQALLAFVPTGALPPFVSASLNGRAVAFAIAAGVTSGVVATLAPAMRVTSGPLARTLVSGARTTVALGRTGRSVGLQHVLVTAECALAVVVLIGAGLLVRSFRELTGVDTGFNGKSVVAARLELPDVAYGAAARARFAELLLARLGERPGITRVALTTDAPLRSNSTAATLRREEVETDRIRYYRHSVTPDYFGLLAIPITAGRAFTAADHEGSLPVAIASTTLARRLWAGSDPIGKRIIAGGTVLTIIGVAGDVRQRQLRTTPGDPTDDPDLYFPFAQRTDDAFDILVRGALPAAQLIEIVRRDVAFLDPGLAPYATGTLDGALRDQTATDRFGSLLLSVFAVLALGLAGVGIYGVMAFFVSQRRREMAIRLALGATPRSVGGLVIRHGAAMLLLGGIAGTIGAALAARVLGAFLYNVQPVDRFTFSAALLVLLITGLLAVSVPARRALRLDPGRALGTE